MIDLRTRRILLISLILLPLAFCVWGASGQRTVGACCMPNGSCSLTTAALCDEKGGQFLGVGTICDDCPPPECDDGDPCTEDSWNGELCVYEKMPCDDRDPCTIDDCSDGVCTHEEIVCSDADPCTMDACSNGDCVYVPIDCSDADPCTIDTCVMGQCRHAPIDCDDGDPCTKDECSAGRCVHRPISCDDTDPCTVDSCVAGDCINEPRNCDDDDPSTLDACSGGTCIHTLIEEPAGASAGAPKESGIDCTGGDPSPTGGASPNLESSDDSRPVLWYVVVGAWGNLQQKLHTALCRAAAKAGVEFRAVLRREEQIDWIERLLLRLPEESLPDLVLTRREAIESLRPSEVGSILFFDIEEALNSDTETPRFIGIPGPRSDWVAHDPAKTEPLVGLEAVSEGLFDLNSLLDPVSALEEILAAGSAKDDSQENRAQLIRDILSLRLGVCRLAITLCGNGTGPCAEILAVDCLGQTADGPGDTVAVFAPLRGTSTATADTASPLGGATAVPDEATLVWFLQQYAADAQRTPTWQRMVEGLPPDRQDESLVGVFRQWLLENGHTDAAGWIAEGMPFPEDRAEFAARFGWFREAMKHREPSPSPWWLRLSHTTSESSAAPGSSTLEPLLWLITGLIDPGTGELVIELLQN